ncbi:MAG TPA: amidohydrolase family protein [Alphaproteobacteria bacterium]
MIVDFQHHFTPRELLNAGSSVSVRLDKNGNPANLVNPLLADLDAHIRMMDLAGIDIAVLSSGAGFDQPDLEICRRVNDAAAKANRDYRGRFVGLAHVPALDGKLAVKEAERCVKELGFPGITIGSELQGRPLDDEALYPLWDIAQKLGVYVFVHPLPAVINWNLMYNDDLGRVIGWEFSLLNAALRMMNAGVLDRFPALTVQFAHFAGGIGRYMGRIDGFVQREKWGTAQIERHNRRPAKSYDHYLNTRLFYDCAGWAGPDRAAKLGLHWIKFGLQEVATSQVVFATDYPQAVRDDREVKEYVQAVKALPESAAIFGNTQRLLPRLAKAA